jgi:hypothetical protein
MDFGVGDLPSPLGSNNINNTSRSMDNEGLYIQGSVVSMKDMDLQPPQGGLPYLVPKANVSRESLHSLSDPRDNPYGAIYTSTPPSPGGALSPFSDQNSISGRSIRNLLPPQLDDQNSNTFVQPSSRVPSPLAFPEIPQQSAIPSPSKLLAQSLSGQAEQYRSASPSLSSRWERKLERDPVDESESVSLSPNPMSSFTEYEQTDITQQRDHDVFEQGIPAPLYIPTPTAILHSTPYHDIDKRSEAVDTPVILQSSQYFEDESTTIGPGKFFSSDGIRSFDSRQEPFDNRVGRGADDHERHAVAGHEDDHAKRIQSVYKEYYGDSQYYDGSEEWESLPQHSNHDIHYQSRPSLPSNSDRQGWHGSAEQYYDVHKWQNENNTEYYGSEINNHGGGHDSIGLSDNSRRRSPPPVQPSYYSPPSTSYSTSSLPSRARTPTKPLEPLTNLPSARYKLDDLASPISFSKPRRFVGTGGQASPINRPASPAQVLSSSWSHLSELPVPHRLRRSGSFSSIDFAPARKYAPSELDAGDTASIRSLARTEASLMAGAGRINRLPQDLVPVGKSGVMASLRPQNYDGNRYI